MDQSLTFKFSCVSIVHHPFNHIIIWSSNSTINYVQRQQTDIPILALDFSQGEAFIGLHPNQHKITENEINPNHNNQSKPIYSLTKHDNIIFTTMSFFLSRKTSFDIYTEKSPYNTAVFKYNSDACDCYVMILSLFQLFITADVDSIDVPFAATMRGDADDESKVLLVFTEQLSSNFWTQYYIEIW